MCCRPGEQQRTEGTSTRHSAGDQAALSFDTQVGEHGGCVQPNYRDYPSLAVTSSYRIRYSDPL